MQAGVVPACTGAVPFRAGLSITQPLYDTMKVLIIKFMARAGGSIAAFARAVWQKLKALLGKVLQALRAKRQAPGDDGYRRIAVLNVLTRDIEVSSSVETGSFFRKRCLRATQCFRLSYGIDRSAAAPVLPTVAIPMDSPVPLKITVEPLGEPRITEKARFWQKHSSMEVAALLGQLTEKARWQAEGDEAAKAAARARLHAVLGTPA